MRFARSAPFVFLSVAAVFAAGFATWPSPTAPAAGARYVPRRATAVDPTLMIGTALPVQAVRTGFVGLSMEYSALQTYAGTDPNAVDPVLVHLIEDLTEGRPTVLRIGGDSTDRTWWPVAGLAPSPADYYTLTWDGLEVAAALARATDARLILGVNFEANSSVEAAAESQAMESAIGPRLIEGLELGNEPEAYGNKWYYKVNGEEFFSRQRSWDFRSYMRDYQHVAAALGRVPLAGPAVGSLKWMRDLGQYLNTENVAVVTLHRYPMQSCVPRPGSVKYPSLANFLSRHASVGPADALRPVVAVAHAHGKLVRNAEMNSVSCGPAYGTANTFASALWMLNTMFAMASVGLDGVNVHTYPGLVDQLFSITQNGSQWLAYVAPEYYGLLMFTQAAPPGSHLLRVSGVTRNSALRAWATSTAGGQTHVVLINEDARHRQNVTFRMPGAPVAGTIERLEAPGVRSTLGVTIGGQTFGSQTTTGLLPGPFHVTRLVASAGRYHVSLPAASAAMLTFG